MGCTQIVVALSAVAEAADKVAAVRKPDLFVVAEDMTADKPAVNPVLSSRRNRSDQHRRSLEVVLLEADPMGLLTR